MWVGSPTASPVNFTAGSGCVLLPHHTYTRRVIPCLLWSLDMAYCLWDPGPHPNPFKSLGRILLTCIISGSVLQAPNCTTVCRNPCLKCKGWGLNPWVTLIPSAMPPSHVTRVLNTGLLWGWTVQLCSYLNFFLNENNTLLSAMHTAPAGQHILQCNPNLICYPCTLAGKQPVYTLENINFTHSAYTLDLKPWYHENTDLDVPNQILACYSYIYLFIGKTQGKVQLNLYWIIPTETYGTISPKLCIHKWQDEGVLSNPFWFPSDFGLPGQSCPYTSVGCRAAWEHPCVTALQCITLPWLSLDLLTLFTLSMQSFPG